MPEPQRPQSATKETSSSQHHRDQGHSQTGKFKIPKKKKDTAQELFAPDKPREVHKPHHHSKDPRAKKDTVTEKKVEKEPAKDTVQKQRLSRLASSEDLGSDSDENELKIAEPEAEIMSPSSDTSDKGKVTNDATETSDKKQSDEKQKSAEESSSSSTSGGGGGQLTKEILQNIVANIDTKEASKLLERANRLISQGQKLSLKELLVGDSDSEDDTSKEAIEAAAKKPAKTTTVAKTARTAKSVKTAPKPPSKLFENRPHLSLKPFF